MFVFLAETTDRTARALSVISVVLAVLGLGVGAWRGWLDWFRGRRSLKVSAQREGGITSEAGLIIGIHNDGGRDEVVTAVGLRSGMVPRWRFWKRPRWERDFIYRLDPPETVGRDRFMEVVIPGRLWYESWPDDEIGSRACAYARTAAAETHVSPVGREALYTVMGRVFREAQDELRS